MVEKNDLKHDEKAINTTKKLLSKTENAPTNKSSVDNNCYIVFSSDDKAIVAQTDKKSSVFETLSQIDVNSKIELKNNMKYLSWAYAWGIAKKLFPNVNYKVYETELGINYFTDGKTCWVKTGVTIDGLEHIEYLPVMDYRNKSIPLGQVTSFDVNKAIQRSLTKALARHGLGLYIFAGEDLPETDEINIDALKHETLTKLNKLLYSFGKENADKYKKMILKTYQVERLEELKETQAVSMLQRLINFKAKEQKAC